MDESIAFLNQDRDAIGFEGVGGRSFEVIEDKFVPLITGCFGKARLNFFFTLAADHHGKRIHDHFFSKAHAGHGVVLDLAEGSGASGAFLGPVTIIATFAQIFAPFGEMAVVVKEGVHRLLRFLGESFGKVPPAREAHRVFKDTFRTFVDFGDGVGIVNLLKTSVAGEALVKGFIVLQRVKRGRNFAHV